MKYEGTMMMDTGIWWVDWLNDVTTPEAAYTAMIAVPLIVFISCWWGIWDRSFTS